MTDVDFLIFLSLERGLWILIFVRVSVPVVLNVSSVGDNLINVVTAVWSLEWPKIVTVILHTVIGWNRFLKKWERRKSGSFVDR